MTILTPKQIGKIEGRVWTIDDTTEDAKALIASHREQAAEIDALKKPSLASSLFDGMSAESDIEQYIFETFNCEFDLGWDSYDCSLEIMNMPADFNLDDIHKEWFSKAGFLKIYISKINQGCDLYDFWDYENKTNLVLPQKKAVNGRTSPAKNIALIRLQAAEIERLEARVKELEKFGY